jgi:hypothetical protein
MANAGVNIQHHIRIDLSENPHKSKWTRDTPSPRRALLASLWNGLMLQNARRSCVDPSTSSYAPQPPLLRSKKTRNKCSWQQPRFSGIWFGNQTNAQPPGSASRQALLQLGRNHQPQKDHDPRTSSAKLPAPTKTIFIAALTIRELDGPLHATNRSRPR